MSCVNLVFQNKTFSTKKQRISPCFSNN